VYLYSALFLVPHTRGAQAWITQYSVTCNYTNAYLYLVSVHQMAPPQTEVAHCSLPLIYLPRNHEGLSRPSWLTYSGRFTHISGHPSAAGRAQDRESSPVKDRRSTNCAMRAKNPSLVRNNCSDHSRDILSV